MVDYPAPVPGVVTQYPSPEHDAYDFACRVGTPVVAVHGGAMRTRWSGRLGHVVEIVGPGGVRSLYAHLDTVKEPGQYEQGEVIGTCGDTGAWSYGAHVHFESTGSFHF